MTASLDWSPALASAVDTVFARGWNLAAEPLPDGSVADGVTAVMTFHLDSESWHAWLTLDESLAAVIAQRLGAAPNEAGAQAGDAAAECLNVLAGRLAGAVGSAADLQIGIPSVQDRSPIGQTILTRSWRTAAGRFSLSLEALA